MSLIIIDFIFQSSWYYRMFLDFNITLMQDGLEQLNFLQQFCHMRTDFYERYKAGCSEKCPNYENLLHDCCEQVKRVLLVCLQTI